MKTCTFCAIVAKEIPAVIVREWPDAIAVRPRSGGCTEGHVMVLPRVHVEDAGTDAETTAEVMRRAAELMVELPAANLVSSKGAEAPRKTGDGLPLPWTPQHAARAAAENGEHQ
ncbi:HIT family protein [Streptomyces sp. NPDC102437]|uniref:HIT family protein n=1 Tax=Streptomyces sp. NPDC102437 TaxID=3366175 RepID=UPI0037F4F853